MKDLMLALLQTPLAKISAKLLFRTAISKGVQPDPVRSRTGVGAAIILSLLSLLSSAAVVAEQVTVTLWDASQKPRQVMPDTHVYIRKFNNSGSSSFYSSARSDSSGLLSLNLPDLAISNYYLQVPSPNTGSKVASPTIYAPTHYDFDIGAHPITVTLKDAQTQTTISNTRVRLYEKMPSGYNKWRQDRNTDDKGQVTFDIDGIATGAKYNFVASNFSGRSERSAIVEKIGSMDFVLGKVQVTVLNPADKSLFTNQRITVRKLHDRGSSFYTYINTDDNGQVLLNLPGFTADPETTPTYRFSMTSPIDGEGYFVDVSADGAFVLSAGIAPITDLQVTLKNGQTGAVIPNTRVRLYRVLESGYGQWQQDLLTDSNGLVSFNIDAVDEGAKFNLVSSAFNGRSESSAIITSRGKFDFVLGEVAVTLTDLHDSKIYADQRITVRQLVDTSSKFFAYINTDDSGKVLINLPGLDSGEVYRFSATLDDGKQGFSIDIGAKGAYELVMDSHDHHSSSSSSSSSSGNNSSSSSSSSSSGSSTEPPVVDVEYPNEVPAIIYPAVAQAPAAQSYGEIALYKKDFVGNQVQPFFTGVPFPRGHLISTDNLLLKHNGQSIAAQFEVLASWPGGSIKSVLVTTQLPANDSGELVLQYGLSVLNESFASSLSVEQGEQKWLVDTGKLSMQLSRQGALIDFIARDIDGDGSIESSERILAGGDIFLVDAFDNKTYWASEAVDTEFTLEEFGDERTVIRLDGSLSHSDGSRLTKFRVRLTLYNQSDLIDMDYTLIDDRLENVYDKTPNLALSVSSYGLTWQHNFTTPQYAFGVDGNISSGVAMGEAYLLQGGEVFLGNGYGGHTFEVSGSTQGEKADGWMSVNSAGSSVNLWVKDFWQNYPNELSVDGEQIKLSLHPERVTRANGATPDLQMPTPGNNRYIRPNTFYASREGIAKTYQLRLQLGQTMAAADVQTANINYQAHGQALTVDQGWTLDSGVFGKLNRADQTLSTGFDSHMLRAIYNRSMQEGRISVTYGWRDYGDRMRPGWAAVVNDVRVPSFYNDTHIGSNNFFKHYLRTGDDRWFELAENATRHFMDIDVSHGPRYGYFKTSTPQPAGEIHALGHEMIDHETRNLHFGHAHLSGLTDYYLITGDKRALDVIEEIGNWWKFMAPYSFKLPFHFDKGYREAERDFGWPLYVMNEYVRVTNDLEYHRQVAGQLVHYLTQWWQSPQPHKFKGEVVGINDASKGTGYWTMTRMDNHGGTDSNGTNPWMAGPLLSSLALYLEEDKYIGSSVKHDDIEEMLLQTMNYIVKYGWAGDDDTGGFCYSEVICSKGGLSSQLVYPLMYTNNLYQQRLLDGEVQNLDWYDTQYKWQKTIYRHKENYRDMSAVANSTALGWYGYEFPFPMQSFRMLEELQ